MSNYLISGYYGFGNAGDEAILEAIVCALRACDSEAAITVLSADPQQTAQEHLVHAINRTSLSQIRQQLRLADLFISGGGGLLQDATSSRSLHYYLSLLWLAQRMGCATMLYANSIGPIRGRINRRWTRRVLQGVDLITVRDQPSLQLLQELGVQKPTIRLTADPVLRLAAPDVQPVSRRIAVVVREWPSQHDYLAAVAAAGRRWVQDDFTVQLIPFHHARDLAVSQQLAQQIGPGAACWEQTESFADLLQAVASAEIVVAMRLHALIMAAVCLRPMVGITYDPKVRGFLQSVEQPEAGTTDDLEADHLYQQVVLAYEQRADIAQHLAQSLAKQRELAALNAQLACVLAKGEGYDRTN